MSTKLAEDGSFQYWPGTTVICPVRAPVCGLDKNVKRVKSQTIWARTLDKALRYIQNSPVGSNFSCLPRDSMHITIVGLTHEKCQPNNFIGTAAELEGEIILRIASCFESAHTFHHEDMEFDISNIIFSSIIAVTLKCKNANYEKELENWRKKVLTMADLPIPAWFMEWHITLAYRVHHPPVQSPEEEARLRSELLELFGLDSTSPNISSNNGTKEDDTNEDKNKNQKPNSKSKTASEANKAAPFTSLILNPPYLAFYPDMTQFPSIPRYYQNQPLRIMLERGHLHHLCQVEPLPLPQRIALPPPASHPDILMQTTFPFYEEVTNVKSVSTNTCDASLHRLCWVVVLGKKLENGEVTKTLEHRLTRGFEIWLTYSLSDEYYKCSMVLCGGFSSIGFDLSEAEAMRFWLLERFESINDTDIITESQSLTTTENALFLRNLIAANKYKHITLKIVTTESHLGRASFIFSTLLKYETNVSIEMISCKDASTKDSPMELWKANSGWSDLMIYQLSNSTYFNPSSPFEMIKRRNLEAFSSAMNGSFDPETIFERKTGNNLATQCAFYRNFDALKVLLSEKPMLKQSLLAHKNNQDQTAFSIALSTENPELAQLILQSVNTSNSPAVSNKLRESISFSRLPNNTDISIIANQICLAALLLLEDPPFELPTQHGDKPLVWAIGISSLKSRSLSSSDTNTIATKFHELRLEMPLPLNLLLLPTEDASAAAQLAATLFDSNNISCIVEHSPNFEQTSATTAEMNDMIEGKSEKKLPPFTIMISRVVHSLSLKSTKCNIFHTII